MTGRHYGSVAAHFSFCRPSPPATIRGMELKRRLASTAAIALLLVGGAILISGGLSQRFIGPTTFGIALLAIAALVSWSLTRQ
jgi:hypothetical protein